MKKWKSRMFLGVIAITMALGLALSPGLAKALTLADVMALGSNGIQIDDKLFYNFGYTIAGGAPTAALISFTPITTAGNPGFLLTSLWVAGTGNLSDSFLTYNVRVLPGGETIADVSASFGGLSQHGTGIASLGENVYLGNDITGPHIANIGLIFDSTNTNTFGEVPLTDPITKLPIKTFGPIFVEKDFGVIGGANGDAAFSSVTNQFSEIPEPTTLILLGSGLLGAALYRRLRKPKG
ncbi:MAG: PEP-CTERM sorting domain-containing protein [Thermodesulfobacteriota bacterium]|jgi:hypothetical protein